MGAFEDFMVLEMSRRSAHLTYETTSYDGDPNSGSAPAILQGAPKGTWFLQQTGDIWWRKRTSAADSWVVADLSSFVTTAPVDIYINGTTGNDDNAGDIANPLATIIEAEKRIPFFVDHVVRIHLGPHTGNGYTQPTFNSRILGANIYIIGDGAGTGDGFTILKAEAGALAGSTQYLVKSSGLGTSQYGGFGQYWGKTIEITSGAAIGDRRTILYNTATDLVPNFPFTAAIAEGDTYRIVRPAINIKGTNPYDIFIDKCGSPDAFGETDSGRMQIFFININLYSTSDYKFRALNSSVGFYGVTSSRNIQLAGSQSTFMSGMEVSDSGFTAETPGIYNDLSLNNITSWSGWGLASEVTSYGFVTVYDGNQFSGSVNCRAFSALPLSRIRIYFGSIWGEISSNSSAIFIYDFAYLEIGAVAMEVLIGSLTNSTHSIKSIGGTIRTFSYTATNSILKLRSSGNCVEMHDRAKFESNDFSPDATLVQSDGGIGLVTKNQGHIKFIYTTPLMNCSGSDFSEDNGNSVHSISLLTSGVEFSDVSHGLVSRE